MPQVFYTEKEYREKVAELDRNAMILAQALCEATGFPCVRGPNNSPFGGKGEYCYLCPAIDQCPYEYKPLPK